MLERIWAALRILFGLRSPTEPTSAELAALVVARLNEIRATDPEAVSALIKVRVPCGPALAAHPSVQIDGDAGGGLLGVAGLLNGIVGELRGGHPRIIPQLDYAEDNTVVCVGFEAVTRPQW